MNRLAALVLASFFVSSGEGNTPWGTPGAIGATTPNTGVFTKLTALDATGIGSPPTTFTADGTARTPTIMSFSDDTANGVAEWLPQFSTIRSPRVFATRARGSQSSPTLVAAGDAAGSYSFAMYDGAQYQTTGQISVAADSAFTPALSFVPGDLKFAVGTAANALPIVLRFKGNGNAIFAMPAVGTSGSTASTEIISYDFNDSTTKTWPTGDFATQRGTLFRAPTYTAAGASTITTASTVDISGAPTCNANMTCTNAYALNVEAGITNLGGDVKVASAGQISISGASSGTATVTSGVKCVCSYSAVTGSATLKTCNVSSTTLTATLSGSDTATVQYFCHF